MILSDREIEAALAHGFIRIEPVPDKKLWTSTAVDLTLDGMLLQWRELEAPPTGASNGHVRPHAEHFRIMAMMEDPRYATKIPIDARQGYRLKPREFILGFTQQKLYLPNYSRIAARVEGKSSLARLGIGVHITAPIIHAGFGYREGVQESQCGSPIQLEIYHHGTFPVILDVGMAICQLILEEVREVPAKGYKGTFSEQQHFAVRSPTPEDAGGSTV